MLLSTFTENHVHSRNHVQFRCHRSIVAKATFIKTEKEIFRKQSEIGTHRLMPGTSNITHMSSRIRENSDGSPELSQVQLRFQRGTNRRRTLAEQHFSQT